MVLRVNNCPERLINEHIMGEISEVKITITKEPVYTQVYFTVDYAFNLFMSSLNVGISQTYNAAIMNARVYTRVMTLQL